MNPEKMNEYYCFYFPIQVLNTYLTNSFEVLQIFYMFLMQKSINVRRARLHCLSRFMFCQISYRILFLLVSIGTSDQKDFSGIRGTLFLPIWMECLPTLRRIFFFAALRLRYA